MVKQILDGLPPGGEVDLVDILLILLAVLGYVELTGVLSMMILMFDHVSVAGHVRTAALSTAPPS